MGLVIIIAGGVAGCFLEGKGVKEPVVFWFLGFTVGVTSMLLKSAI